MKEEKGIYRGLRSLMSVQYLMFYSSMMCLYSLVVASRTSLFSMISCYFLSATTGMEIKKPISTITFSACSTQETTYAYQKFPFQSHQLDEGLKYLGFCIKPHGYKISNWMWLVTKVKKELLNWNHHFLSRAGRLVIQNGSKKPSKFSKIQKLSQRKTFTK